MGMVMALAARYAVKIQPAWSSVIDRLPWISRSTALGSGRLADCMYVASSTANLSERAPPGCGFACAWAFIRSYLRSIAT